MFFVYAVRDDVGRFAFFVDADSYDENATGYHFEYFNESCYAVDADMLMSYEQARRIVEKIGGEIVTYKVEEY